MSVRRSFVRRLVGLTDPRRILVFFTAVAAMIAPLSIASASALVPGHGAMMAGMGHCRMPASGSSAQGKMAGKTCCVSMTMAVTIAVPAVSPAEPGTLVPMTAAALEFHLGFLGEIATPPPRNG